MKCMHELCKASMLLLLSSSSFAAVSKDIFIPVKQSHYHMTFGAVYLQLGSDNLGWAVTTTVLPIPTPEWKVHTLDPSYQPGFTLGFNYDWDNIGADLQFDWTHLNTNNTSKISVDPANQWISPFSQTGTPPTGGEITGVASLKTATGQVKFDYDVVNIDFGKYVDLAPFMQVRFFSGLSGIYLQEKLTSAFNGLPKVEFTLNNTSRYAGIGPRFGINNLFHIYQNFNLIFQMSGSLLIGNMKPAQYEFVGNGSALQLIGIINNSESLSSQSVTQIVPAVDTKVGINYLFMLSHDTSVNVELGWMGALYINPLSSYETNTNVIALDSGSLSTSSVKHVTTNFSATGPYLTITVNL